MSRVRQNIATLVDRLAEIGYEFDPDSGDRNNIVPFGPARWRQWMKYGSEPGAILGSPIHRPPLEGEKRISPFQPTESGLRHRLRRLERDAGELPISLRAWYEVVGSVTLIGRHPVLSPDNGNALTEPLVVAPFSQILRDWDNSPPDVGVDGRPFVADISAGHGHQITLPSVCIDALLENERHGLAFVDYLRFAFHWGGFPGLESARKTPKEIEFLTDGLLTF